MSIDVNGTGFMARAVDFNRIGGIPAYPNLLFADFTLWLQLARLSYKVTSEKNCFAYRLHQSMTTTSPDEKFHSAFEQFVQYVASLKKADPALNEAVNQHARTILAFYCKSFSHRLLRTKMKERNNQTVKEWSKKCDGFANLLIDDNAFEPSAMATVRLARCIDSNAFTRQLFLIFKKIYAKPVF